MKLSTAVTLAIQAADLAMQGCWLPAGEGIVAPSIEETFANMAELNDPGMVETDRLLLQIVRKNASKRT